MKDPQKNNPLFVLHDKIIACKDKYSFETTIKDFLWNDLIFDRKVNVNSIFQAEKQPKYRDNLIFIVKTFCDKHYFDRYFTLSYEEKDGEFTFKKTGIIL